jgi:hypothetical protein
VLDDQTADAALHDQAGAALNKLMGRANFTGVWELPWAGKNVEGRSGFSGQVRWGVILPSNPSGCNLQ